MKLLIIQKYDLQIIAICCYSISSYYIKEHCEGICLKGYGSTHFFTFFCIIAIVKSNMSIENDYSFVK